MAAGLIFGLCLLTALLFRFGSSGAGLAAAGATALASIGVGVSAKRLGPVETGGLLMLAAALSIAGALPGVWPCGLECHSADDYRTLFDLPVFLLAAAAYLAAAAAFLALQRRPGLAELAAWGLIGATVYYLGLSARLGLACGPCLSVHTAVVATLAGVARGRSRFTARSACAVVALLLLRELHRLELDRPAPAVPPPVAAVDDDVVFRAADLGRRLGEGNQALRVEIVVSFKCAHCGGAFAPLHDALRPFAEKSGVEIVLRHALTSRKPAAKELLKYAFAAAARGRYEELMVAGYAALGAVYEIPRGSAADGEKAYEEMRERMRNEDALTLAKLKEKLDLKEEAALIAGHPAAFDRLLREEDDALKALEFAGGMPLVVLIEPASGATLERLERPSVEKIVAAVKRHLRRR